MSDFICVALYCNSLRRQVCTKESAKAASTFDLGDTRFWEECQKPFIHFTTLIVEGEYTTMPRELRVLFDQQQPSC